MRSTIALVFFVGVLLAAPFSKAEGAERPNIIFFLTDDQRHDFLGCSGHPIIKTPVIDKLAERGTRFENAFVTTSICATSRATLFTGLYERTHGYNFGKPAVSKKHMDDGYPVQLRKAGYRTGFVGKFGVAVQKGAQAEMFDYYKPHNRNPYFHKQPDGSLRHETEVAGDRAVEFLRGTKADGKPFCLSVSFNASHAEDSDKKDHFPYPKAVAHLYEGMKMPPPRHADPKVFESQPEFLRKSMNRDRYFWRWDTEEKYQHNMRNYLRMISGIDGVIGRVQKELETLGLADNTIIIYMADNGYYAASRGFAGKWSHYEESQRVPLIIMDPRVKEKARGIVSLETVLNVDIAPTMLAYAGVERPKGHQGLGLNHIVDGVEVGGWRMDFFCEHQMNHKSIPKWEGVRGVRYKYARYTGQEPVFEFLHDLRTDPNEFTNLAGDPKHAKTLEEMRKRCDELRDEYSGVAAKQPTVGELIEKAKSEAREDELDKAAKTLGVAIRQEPSVMLYEYRAQLFRNSGNHKRAIADYTAAMEIVDNEAKLAELRQDRGIERFYQGEMKGAVEDFDAYLEANPQRVPQHWQRGLAHYYAGMFKEGREQFEVHQTYNTNDVENAAWHFLCVARLEGIEKAREKFIPIEGDSRVPMAEVHQLFAGKIKPEAVLKAAEDARGEGVLKRNHMCYAHLYLGLYFEAVGEKEKSLEHIKKSAVDFKMEHYMGKTAQVHWKLRKPKGKK